MARKDLLCTRPLLVCTAFATWNISHIAIVKSISWYGRCRSGAGRSEYRYHPVVEEEELESWSDDGEGDAHDDAAGKGKGAASATSNGANGSGGARSVIDRLAA